LYTLAPAGLSHHGAVEPNPNRRTVAIELVVIDLCGDYIFRSGSRHRLRDQIAHQQAGDGCITIGRSLDWLLQGSCGNTGQ
jgi:hypothetical protein